MSRPVLLLTIGADALPNTTPVIPVSATWVPAIYVPPAVPVPGAFAAVAIVDGVLLSWTAVPGASPYVVERAPDVAGVPGAWIEIGRPADLSYTATVANGTKYWWRVKAVVFSRASAFTAAIAETPVTVAGNGVNLLPDEYSTLESTTLPAYLVSNGSITRDAVDKIVAAAHVFTATALDNYVYFGTGYNIPVTPGKRYIVSFNAKASVANTGRIYLQDSAGVHYSDGAAFTTAWNRVSAILDLTASTANAMRLRIDNEGGAGSVLRVDGLMVQEAIGTLNKPSTYTRGTSAGQSIAAQIAANAANAAIADISSNNVLTAGEKPVAIQARDVIVAEQAGIDAQATAYGITTEKTSYDSAVSALTAYLATLTAPVLWSDLTGNTTIAGATFRAKFSDVYAARQALLNKIVALAKSLADAANVTGSTKANGANLIPNPTFQSNAVGATTAGVTTTSTDMADGWVTRDISSSGGFVFVQRNSTAMRCYVGNPTIAGGAYAVAQVALKTGIPVEPNAVYSLSSVIVQAANGVLTAGITAESRTIVQWFDGNGGLVGATGTLAQARGAAAPAPLDILAPATARTCVVYADTIVRNTTAGALVANTSTVALYTDLQSVSLIRKLSLDAHIDNGDVYARIKGSELTSGEHRLGIAGSGKKFGDQRNAPNSLSTGFGAVRSTAALSASSSGTVSVNAHTLTRGPVTTSYSANASAVTGLAQNSTYYIYARDNNAGGSPTWLATTSATTANSFDDAYIAGKILIPASGTSTGGAPEGCVACTAWVIRRTQSGCETIRAGDVVVGDELLLASGRYGRVSRSTPALAPCVRVQCAVPLAALTCSTTAPLGLATGGQVLAPDSLDARLRVLYPVPQVADLVVSVESVGDRWVQHITCEDDFFMAGDDPEHLISHHNLKP